ncbi:MAG: hypothetical protein BWY78_00696 [Alphaproteobacteria bacterium ADurb.Bin438]|nr:MAG: hypothetical protein BWY78_00696 [Alphaproteobacteria bacterium ADurb.Bin438]
MEHFYSIHNKGKLEEYLTDIFKSGSFKQDIKDISPAPHELVSAYLSVTCFSQQIEELNGDKEFITRAIIGCKYKSKDGSLPKILKLKNAFMEILSSKIDVDKLDYILRDTWASGAHNTTIDIERLLGSLKIVPYKNTYRLVFKANALSVIGSVIEGRNYLYRFIYNHHKVLYEAEIINRAVLKLSENISKGEKETFLSQIFNINVFFKKTLYKAITLFYPNDADFTYFLKADEDNNPYANEFLARNHKRFPLWKTFAHFKVLYAHKKKYELANIVEERDKIINSFTKKHGLKRDDIIVLKASPKTSHIMNDDVLVEIGGKICELTELYPSENENKSYDMDCPFVYLSRDKAHLKEELIKFIDEYI